MHGLTKNRVGRGIFQFFLQNSDAMQIEALKRKKRPTYKNRNLFLSFSNI